jgi:diphosphomevalonate decarboxylase
LHLTLHENYIIGAELLMNKSDIVKLILKNKPTHVSSIPVTSFSPSNIALCKYWGKRDEELNLPFSSSLSISLGNRGTYTTLSLTTEKHDQIYLSDHLLDNDSALVQRLVRFLDLFRFNENYHFKVKTHNNIPIAAGLASSASGFAVITQALNKLFGWNLSNRELSILARLGSGSASRSIQPGFCYWYRGTQEEGMDSYAEQLSYTFPGLCVGLLIVNDQAKKIGSSIAMKRTVDTSDFYASWIKKTEADLINMQEAIAQRNMRLLGEIAESNALAMHACMLTAKPAILYSEPATIAMMNQVWQARAEGLSVYFTQDAGPNLKLLFLENEIDEIKKRFPAVEIIKPFDEYITLVDEQDQMAGSEEKLITHQKGLLHRAFSVFIFRQHQEQWQLLLQQRHVDKYHCGGLWTNTCCGHPRSGEEIDVAAMRRLNEEIGLKVQLKNQVFFITLRNLIMG